METLIIHSTKYGSTEKYALQIAKKLQCSVVKSTNVKLEDLKPFDVIILGSCLLEGELADSLIYNKWAAAYPDKYWALFTVGLANPALTDFTEIMNRSFSSEVISQLKLFHYRGTIQYKRLLLMDSLFKKAREYRVNSIDNVKLGAENKNLLHKYGTNYDIGDEGNIEGLIEWVKSIKD